MSPQPKPGEGHTNKRRRELARAKEERQIARRVARDAARRRRLIVVGGISALVVVVVAIGLLFWPDGAADSPDAAAAASSTPSAAASGTEEATVAGCKQAPTPTGQAPSYPAAPETKLKTDTEYTLTLTTNCGRITIATLPEKAPKTVNSMLWLAQQGYFNKTLCHRLTTAGIHVLQCGDPQATGSGGPGYSVPDENLPKEGTDNYPAGTVAMANAGPGTSGSQFFIVYKDTTLPAGYTVWGRVVKGLDVVSDVAGAGVAGEGTDGAPAQPIGIIKAVPKPALAS